MAPSRATASYKKNEGTIAVTKDRQHVIWSPSAPSATLEPVKLSVSTIANLQKSKVSVKIILHPSEASTPDNYVFTFPATATGRSDLESIVDLLRQLLLSNPPPASTAPSETDGLSDATLVLDTELQMSLLTQNAQLRQRFEESLKKIKNVPDVIPLSQFSSQFWSARIHLLRAHAVEKRQKQGTYNVLSEVKLKRDNEGVIKINVSKEQIQLIFNQHPLVRKVYNDLVPNRYTEPEFWSKFFVSKLFKKLKGERITDADASIADLDKYLAVDESTEPVQQFVPPRIPRFLDMEGNAQDHTQSRGNAAHMMMRAESQDKSGIVQRLNSMSKKMLVNSSVTASSPLHAPTGVDATTYAELKLRDLQNDTNDSRITLNLSRDQKFFSHDSFALASTDFTGEPSAVIAHLSKELSPQARGTFDMDDSAKRQAATTSRSIMKTIKQHLNHLGVPTETQSGLSKPIIETAAMTHNTTIEFLHYFWTVYLSGDEARSAELAKLVEMLDKSLDRINAVATDAEAERANKIEEKKRRNEEYAKRTGKRVRLNVNQIGGGGDVLRRMMAATSTAVKYAEAEYQKTFEEQSARSASNEMGAK